MSAQQTITFFLTAGLSCWIGWAYGSWWATTGRELAELERRIKAARVGAVSDDLD